MRIFVSIQFLHRPWLALPNWARDSGLKRVGLYYEGIVDDENLVRQKHQADTVSTFGVRRSRSSRGFSADTQSKSDDHDIGSQDKVFLSCV